MSRGRRGHGVESVTPPAGSIGAGSPAVNVQVWVNTASGKYFRPGSRYCGKTKQGRYMNEAEAIKAAYHPVQPGSGPSFSTW